MTCFHQAGISHTDNIPHLGQKQEQIVVGRLTTDHTAPCLGGEGFATTQADHREEYKNNPLIDENGKIIGKLS